MALLNKSEVFHRRIYSGTLTEDANWVMVFEDKDGKLTQGVMGNVDDVRKSAHNAYLIAIANFCLNNADEANLWTPQLALLDLTIEEIEPGFRNATFNFANDVKFTAWIADDTYMEILENIVLYGIDYYFDHLVESESYTVVREAPSAFSSWIIKVMGLYEVALIDNANLPITEDQVVRALPWIYRTVAMLRGAYNSPFKVGPYAQMVLATVSDFSIPSFRVNVNPSVLFSEDNDFSNPQVPHVNPSYVCIEGMSYIVTDLEGQSMLTVNE